MSSDWPTDNGMIATILEEAKYIKTNGLEVDIQKWSKMSSWTVIQAVYIFHGLDPVRGLRSENLKPYPIYKRILDAYDIMMSFASDNKIPHEGDPMLFFGPAELVGLTVSDELKSAVLMEGNKRDLYDLERKARLKAFKTDLEADAIPVKVAEKLFTVNIDKEIRETFHDEIRCILVELSEAGERKPTGGQMRSYLKGNPKKAPRFVKVDRKGDIHFDSDAAGKKITQMTREALHKLINRYATKTV